MKRKSFLILVIILLWTLTGIKVYKDTTKLTYLEYKYQNNHFDGGVTLKNNNSYVEQKFISPYKIVNGFSVKIGTFGKDNNSIWNISLIDKENKKTLYSKDYNASLITDNSFHMFKFDKNIKIKEDNTYLLRISAKKVNNDTKLLFYTGRNSNLSGLIQNGHKQNKALCFAVYGGDFDSWWILYDVLMSILITLTIIRGFVIYSKGMNPIKDKLFGSMIIFFVVLLLLNSFSTMGVFTDESDNIRGGMIISRGGVLYRDYVTQHTPVMYYLCGLFALLGAGSIQQFRLSYYVFEALIWALLYIRHVDAFGKKKMLLLPLLECSLTVSLLMENKGHMILSDNMQGLCMVVLLLEFLHYLKDKRIGWDRSIIISFTIWASFGSAFISAYAILFVVISVLGLELIWNSKVKRSLDQLIHRYYKLAICMIVPFLGAVLYFKLNHSLKRAFEQFYLFNKQVYSQYQPIGDNLLEPFIVSIQNYFEFIPSKINAIISSTLTNVDLLQLFIFVLVIVVIATLCMKKRFIESVTIFSVMIFSASRGYDFHGLAAWYVAIMIIVLFGEDAIHSCIKRINVPITVIIAIFMVGPYVISVGNNLLFVQQPVTEIESKVIDMTKENEDVLIDAYSCDSIYLLYKNRYPSNRSVYMLPWYMDWYEQDTINDLRVKKPKIVVYNPDQETWGYKHYSNAFFAKLKNKYKQLSNNPNDDWRYKVWVRK